MAGKKGRSGRRKLDRPWAWAPVGELLNFRGISTNELGRRYARVAWISVEAGRRAVCRAKRAGTLTDREADLMACALGCHPWQLWPTYFEIEVA